MPRKDPEAIFQQCMLHEDRFVRASDVGLAWRSEFAVWCNEFADPREKDEDTTLADLGMAHEENVIECISPEIDVVQVPVRINTESFRNGLDMMMDGVDEIRGVCLFGDGIVGIPDLLVRIKGRSAFGNHAYMPMEIKSAANITRSHRIQGACYAHLLKNVQGRAPDFVLMDGNREEHRFKYADYERAVLVGSERVREIMNGLVKPQPAYGYEPTPWSSYGNKLALEKGDISLVNGIGQVHADACRNAGIETVHDLLARSGNVPPCLNEGHITRARAIAEKRVVYLGTMDFPNEAAFVDLEGEPMNNDGDYLIGVLWRGKYISFVAKSKRGQRRMLRDFLDWCGEHDVVLFHWGSYDSAHIRNVMRKHRMSGDFVFGMMRDLKTELKRAYAVPIPTYKLKDIGNWCGFHRKSDLDAFTQYRLYQRYSREGDKAVLKKVLEYNEDDCRETEYVYEWFCKHASRDAG